MYIINHQHCCSSSCKFQLNCCAVEDEGWEIYQQSSWYLYKRHNNFGKLLLCCLLTQTQY